MSGEKMLLDLMQGPLASMAEHSTTASPFTGLQEELSFTEILTSCLPESSTSMSLFSHILQEGIAGTTSCETADIHAHPSCSDVRSNHLRNLGIPPQHDLRRPQYVHSLLDHTSSCPEYEFATPYKHGTSSHGSDSATVLASAWPPCPSISQVRDEAPKPSTSSATSEPSSTLESMDACDFAAIQKRHPHPSHTGGMGRIKEPAQHSCQTSLDEGSSMQEISLPYVNMGEDACRTSSGAGDCGAIALRPAASKRKRSKVCKNSEEVESQRRTHIAVERNRRKQMNEHLGTLRSLMPAPYIQRGDQASIIGGAINFVKELEHVLQTLQAQRSHGNPKDIDSSHKQEGSSNFWKPMVKRELSEDLQHGKEFCPSNVLEDEFTVTCEGVVVDVRLIGTSALVKVLTTKTPHQLLQVAFSIESFHMKIMHLNITTLDKSVLYSLNLEVQGGSQFQSANGIAQFIQSIFRVQQ